MKNFVHSIVRKRIWGWENIHNQGIRGRYASLEGWVSIGVNFFLFVLKGALGIFAGSVSLIADAFHTLSDVSTSAIIIVSFRIAKKPSDASHPFGHGRMEAVATVMVAVVLLVVGVEVFKGALGRILHPEDFESSWLIIGIIFFTVVVKELLARFSRELGRMIGSEALEGDFWHHRTDAVSSALVIVAFIGQRFGMSQLDGAVGIIVAGMIGYTGWKIARSGIDDLLGRRPSDDFIREVKMTVREFPKVLDVHDLIVHQYGQMAVMSFHIQVSEKLSCKYVHTLSEKIERTINEKYHAHATIHFDPVNTEDPELMKIRKFVKGFLDKRGGVASYHDLRWMGKDNGGKILFDLTVDQKMKEDEIEVLKKELGESLRNTFPSVVGVVIEVEPKYAL